MENKKFVKGFLLGVFMTAVIGLGVYLFVFPKASQYLKTGEGSSKQEAEKVDPDSLEAKAKIEALEYLIDKLYLDDVDKNALTESMYAGMVEGLGDPYSHYYTKEEYEALQESTSGEFEGIGIIMQQDPDTGIITVARCYENAPAANAGVLPGDAFYTVNGVQVTGMELSAVSDMIRKSESPVAHLVLVREGNTDYVEVDVERAVVEVPSVTYEMLDNKVGYIGIYEFTSVTPQQYADAFEDLKSQGIQKLVIDLRGNPGGLLTSVTSILETMLPEGLIVYTEDKYGNRKELTSDGESVLDLPLAVLVNEYSASASEIFAGAVQDYGIGTIVGTTTFGKGIVQSIQTLSDGSAVKLTIANYYTPKGRNIHGTGICPDVEVELDEALKQKIAITHEEDNQLQKALEVLGE
ncbi:MAG: S41 family peptidase [Lachnospiraceae bacterium]|jgi:carboxyl-terminal processing protease